MYRKVICYALLIALTTQIGCYSLREITLEEALTNDDIDDVNVLTKDSLRYIFEKPDFYVSNDTINGKAGIISRSQVSAPFDKNIPMSEVVTLETDEMDFTKTLIFVGASLLVAGGIIILLLAGGGLCHNCNF